MFLPQMFRGRQYSGNSFWEAMLGGVRSSQSKTGIIITPETALGLSAIRACVTLLAESVAQLPCELTGGIIMAGASVRRITRFMT